MSSLNPKIDQTIKILVDKFGNNFTTNKGIRNTHSKDESWHHPSIPDGVVFPNSNEEISEILKICNEHKVPVTAFGTGTCLEGNVIPTSGGIVVDMEKNEFSTQSQPRRPRLYSSSKSYKKTAQ